MAEQEHFGKGNFNTALKNKGARGIRLFAAVVPAALAPLSQADVATNVFKKMTWPELSGATTGQRLLVVSIGGLGWFAGGDVDDIKDLAKEFTRGREDVIAAYGISLIGPDTIDFDGAINDNDLAPSPGQLAARIDAVMERMAPGAKLVLIGKSMSGCTVLKASGRTRRPVDLLITVDASCSPACHEDTKEIGSNVRAASNYRQNSPKSKTCNLRQCGHKVARSRDAAGLPPVLETDVNRDETFPGSSLCDNANHCSIDNCTGLLNRIRGLVRKVMDSVEPAQSSFIPGRPGQW